MFSIPAVSKNDSSNRPFLCRTLYLRILRFGNIVFLTITFLYVAECTVLALLFLFEFKISFLDVFKISYPPKKLLIKYTLVFLLQVVLVIHVILVLCLHNPNNFTPVTS